MSRTCLSANPSLDKDERASLKRKYNKALSEMLCVNKDHTISDLPTPRLSDGSSGGNVLKLQLGGLS